MKIKGDVLNSDGSVFLHTEIDISCKELAEQLTGAEIGELFASVVKPPQKECSCKREYKPGGVIEVKGFDKGKAICNACGLPIPKAKYPCCSSAERNGEECPIHKERLKPIPNAGLRTPDVTPPISQCEHEWIFARKEGGALDGNQVCKKCGGIRLIVEPNKGGVSDKII